MSLFEWFKKKPEPKPVKEKTTALDVAYYTLMDAACGDELTAEQSDHVIKVLCPMISRWARNNRVRGRS